MQMCEATVRRSTSSENQTQAWAHWQKYTKRLKIHFTLKLEPQLVLFSKMHGSKCVFVKLTVCVDFGTFSARLFSAVELSVNGVTWEPSTLSPFSYEINHFGEFITSWGLAYFVQKHIRENRPDALSWCLVSTYDTAVESDIMAVRWIKAASAFF